MSGIPKIKKEIERLKKQKYDDEFIVVHISKRHSIPTIQVRKLMGIYKPPKYYIQIDGITYATNNLDNI